MGSKLRCVSGLVQAAFIGWLGLFSGCNKAPHFSTTDRFAPFQVSQNLEKDFQNPPQQARPWAFWWWLEGNIDKAGIRKDLVAMKKVGLAGALIYDAGSSSYRDVQRTPAGPAYMSDAWCSLFKDAVRVADSLGLQISMNITSGWNDGGPWVQPRYAAKRLVWSKTRVKGPKKLDQMLPLPKNVYRSEKDSVLYFQPVTVLAVPLSDSSAEVSPLLYFSQKAVHNVGVPQTPNGYNWSIFLQEDSASLKQHSVRLRDLIDISEHVDSTGRIRWNAPAGSYAIYRFGYSGTGSRVSTSSPGGEGLAIDYMDTAATDLQFHHVPAALIQAAGRHVGKSLMYLHDDSWELGAANWTPGFVSAFKALRNYDPIPYLPVIAGEIVDNKSVSNRFLYDFRRTIADLIAQNHYERLKTLAHQNGLGVHPEGGGPHPAPIDALKNLGINDIPMGEFWAKVKTHRVRDYERIFVKQSASAAHTYGRRYVQAEGPTSIGPQWEMDPRRLKPTIDRAFCEGLNRLVFHTFTHSPDEVGKPGNEYFAGTHFNPNITWWKQAPAYVDYISRCQFLLQQGAFVADVCYYYGDNVPNQVHLKRIDSALGEGYDYDWVDTQVLLDSMEVRDHEIYLKDGMHYRVLVLPDRKRMPLPVLRKIKQLVRAGATVIGPKPVQATGLSGYPTADRIVHTLADELWGNQPERGEKKVGKGKVVWGKTIRKVLEEAGVQPDFVAEGKRQLQDVDYIHRTYKDYDIYFISNWKDTAQHFMADFRVHGKVPAFWHADDGQIIPAMVYSTFPGHTSLPIALPAYGSVFVVFKKAKEKPHVDSIWHNGKQLYPFPPASEIEASAFGLTEDSQLVVNQGGHYTYHLTDHEKKQWAVDPLVSPDTLSAGWTINFDTSWGGPAEVHWDSLMAWNQSQMTGIRYYSGTAIYKNHFHLGAGQADEHTQVVLDLHSVFNVATVKINNGPEKVLWKYPFSLDITPFIHKGENTLAIKVVNLWPNRIIGDQYLSPDQRYTHTNVIKFTKDYPLLPSGLIGPVVLRYQPTLKIR